MLMNLEIDHLTINGEKVPLPQLLGPLMAYSTNRHNRYEQLLEEFCNTSESWEDAYEKICRVTLRDTIMRHPFLALTLKEYQAQNSYAVSLDEKHSEHILNRFSYDLQALQEDPDRHKEYNVYQKPFIKVGIHFFCPVMFFSTNLWFYSFMQKAMQERGGSAYKPEIIAMEEHLKKLFADKGWYARTVSEKEAMQVRDVDVIADDGEHCILIQLKRTNLQLDPEGAYNESLLVDEGAAKQLNHGTEFLSGPNDIYKIKNPVSKWIVTTSFENINQEIDGCRKINYFELVHALDTGIKNIKELVNYIEKDSLLRSMCKQATNPSLQQDAKEFMGMLGLPIKEFEPKEYIKSVFALDEEASTKYHELFNYGLERDSAKDKPGAARALMNCINLEKKDGDAWWALANVFADTKDFVQSFACFEEALELLPNDPFVLRNYALALRDAGQLYLALSLLMDIHEKYPLFGHVGHIIEVQLRMFTEKGWLNNEHARELNERWKNLSPA
jgi:tetratricopeptide (TPR) repeat protein